MNRFREGRPDSGPYKANGAYLRRRRFGNRALLAVKVCRQCHNSGRKHESAHHRGRDRRACDRDGTRADRRLACGVRERS